MKNIKKYLSAILVVTMLSNTIFVKTAFAAGAPASEVKSADKTEIVDKEAKIIGEVAEKREKNVKHFLKENLTYEASVYAYPIHYKKDGKWEEIDNTLSEANEEQGSKVLKNKQNDFSVKFAKNSNSNKLVKLGKDKYELSWGLKDGEKSAVKTDAQVKAADEAAVNSEIEKSVDEYIKSDTKYSKASQNEKAEIKKTLVENEKKKNASKTKSELSYTDIFPKTDLQYILEGDKLKENIIIKEKLNNVQFQFNISVKNLVPKLEKDNTITFYDSSDSSKKVFQYQAPFMYDANGVESGSVKLELKQDKKDFILTIIPDNAWLSDVSRKFPVIVDPPVNTSLDVNSIKDTFVAANDTQDKYNNIFLRAGNKSGIGVTRSFIKFDLPLLTSAETVIYADLKLVPSEINNGGSQVNAHKVTGSWNTPGLLWGNKPSYDPIVSSYIIANSINTDYYVDITSIARDWYNTGINNGVMLKANDEVNGNVAFYSSDISGVNAWARPQARILYINNSGLEDYWTYSQASAGRAGTSYVNDFNGNLIFTHEDLSMNGNRMPVSLQHIYNSNDKASSMGFGYGWRLNLSQSVALDGASGYYVYTDGDGTRHFFKPESNGTYKDESGLDLTLTKNADSSYTIKDKKDGEMYFTPNGYLKTIKDSNGNLMTLNYYDTILLSVTDGAGRVTNLEYYTDPASPAYGFLKTIIDPSGRRTEFGYENKKVSSITYPDEKTSTYSYDSSSRLIQAKNFDEKKVDYSYYDTSANRVKKVLESHTDDTLGSELNITYGTNTTTFTNHEGRKSTYQFNEYGNTVSVVDSEGKAEYYKYIHDDSQPNNSNKLELQSKLQTTIINSIRNHNAETNGDWQLASIASSTGSGSFSSEAKYIGNQSLKITKTNNTGTHYYSQAVNLEKGKNYTFSAYVKTQGVSNSKGNGAVLYVTYQDKAGVTQAAFGSYVSGTQDFKRYELSFTLPADSVSTTVWPSVGIANETGTAYFDAMQLEEGFIANRYNLVENPNLTYGDIIPSFWYQNGESESVDKLVTTEAGTYPKGLNDKSYKMTGVAAKQKALVQNINVKISTGDAFVVGGWAKGNAVPNKKDEIKFGISVGLVDSAGNTKWNEAYFNPSTSDWQYISNKIVADKDYQRIVYYVMYYKNANAAYFDGMQLYKESFGQSYAYDANGNVTSAVDLAEKNSTFEYNDKNDMYQFTDAKSSKFTYSYDSAHNVTGATSAEGVKYSFTDYNKGNPETSAISDGTLSITSKSTYTADGNYPDSLTDSSGNVVDYNYNLVKGVLDTVEDPKHKITSYNYDELDRLTNVSKSGVVNGYSYEKDRIDTITHNNFNYKFEYDSLGNNTKVKVGNQILIENTFDTRTGLLKESLYGNGQKVSTNFDSSYRPIATVYNGVAKFNYVYDGSGSLGYKYDDINKVAYRYVYDMADRLSKVSDTNGNEWHYNFDANNNLSSVDEKLGGGFFSTKYTHDKDNRLTNINYWRLHGSTVDFSYDGLGRLWQRKLNTGKTDYYTKYEYAPDIKATPGRTTTKINKITNGTSAIEYTHDPNGNIETIKANGKTIKYYYNDLNELVREDNEATGITTAFDYDAGGNILSKKEYKYTTQADLKTLTPTKTYSYQYGDTNWKDKLTSYDGKAITYDAIGNPLTYNGNTYTWQYGRQLAAISGNGKNISYKYNDSGIRTEKTVNGVTTKYRLDGDKVTFEYNGTDYIYYTYDDSGNLVSGSFNDIEYYYIRNAQGDIIGLIDENGVQVVSYNYDAWGKLTATEAEKNDVSDTVKDGITGALASTIGIKNPYKYKGYSYDTETGLYYLQSRYYSPEWGRFINADGYLGTPGELLSHNLFAYSANNPINRDDPNGESWGALVVGAAAVFAIPAEVAAVLTVGVIAVAAAGIYALVDIAVQEYRNNHVTYNTTEDSTSSSKEQTGPYSDLKDSDSVAAGKDFTPAQKKKIIEANKKRNGGKVKSDDPADLYPNLVKPVKSKKGETPLPSEWQIDHIIPKSKGGTNSFDNARVISRHLNRLKWDK